MKRRYLAGAVVAVTFIAGAFLLLMARSEPSYGGRSLSYWLNEARVNRSEQATNAIRALGTNAWPFLVKRAGAIDGKFKRFLIGQLGIGVKYWSGARNAEAAILLGSNCSRPLLINLPLHNLAHTV